MRLDRILGGAVEPLDPEMLFDPFEEQSSKVDSNKIEKMMPTTHEGKKANEFYQSILGIGPFAPNIEAIQELAVHFQTYADEINK